MQIFLSHLRRCLMAITHRVITISVVTARAYLRARLRGSLTQTFFYNYCKPYFIRDINNDLEISII